MNKIAIFSKKPEPGKSKTRLSPPLTLNEANELSEAFLKDTIKLIDNLGFIDQRIIYCYPPRAFDYFKSIVNNVPGALKRGSQYSSQWFIKVQKGRDLGERLSNAIDEELPGSVEKPATHDKMNKFIIIGSDSPTIPGNYIKEAFLILENEEIVLGPARDGGFYLIGLKRIWRGIFNQVRWSTNNTLKDIIINLEKLSLKFKLLPEWYDIDEVKDIRKLSKDIKEIPGHYCRNTRILLSKLERKSKLS